MKRRWAAFILLVSMFMTVAGGCWSRKNMSDLAFVLGLGFDVPPGEVSQGAADLMTLQIAVTSAYGGEPGAGGGEPVWILSAPGKSPSDAHAGLTRQTGRTIFYGHTRAVIIGEERAKQGIESILDFLERFPEFRRSLTIFIAQGEARGILEAVPKLDQIGTVALARMAEAGVRAFAVPVGDFISQSESGTLEAAAPMVTTSPPEGVGLGEKPPEPGGGGDGGGNGGQGGGEGGGGGGSAGVKPPESIPRLDGVALFRGKKMVGSLSGREAEAYMTMTGRFRNQVYAFDHDELGRTGAILRRISVSHQADAQGDQARIRIKVDVRAELMQTAKQADFTDERIRKSVESALATQLEEDIRSAMNRMQQYQSDVIGFGGMIWRKDSRRWNQIKSQWSDMFARADVKVEAKAKIIRTGAVWRTTGH